MGRADEGGSEEKGGREEGGRGGLEHPPFVKS